MIDGSVTRHVGIAQDTAAVRSLSEACGPVGNDGVSKICKNSLTCPNAPQKCHLFHDLIFIYTIESRHSAHQSQSFYLQLKHPSFHSSTRIPSSRSSSPPFYEYHGDPAGLTMATASNVAFVTVPLNLRMAPIPLHPLRPHTHPNKRLYFTVSNPHSCRPAIPQMNSANSDQPGDSRPNPNADHNPGSFVEPTAHSGTSPVSGQDALESAQNGQPDSGNMSVEVGPPSEASSDSVDFSDEGGGMAQGPSQAPTEVGVSTLGLSEQDASFFSACYDADVKVIEEALNKGQDVNVRDVNRRTALHFCAGNGLPTLCKRLLGMGAEINAQDVLGYTPLHMAAGYRKLDSVRVLIEAGVDANIGCNNGELAVEVAERLLERTPQKRFFVPNPEYKKMKEIVRVLDEATEIEDDEEEGAEKDEVQELREETDKAKFVVRVKPKGGATKTPPPPPTSDVKVTIRVKKPEK